MIYLLQVREGDPVMRRPWDCLVACVVSAASEDEARQMANVRAMDEGNIWIDPARVTAREISDDEPPGFICADIREG